jgi:phospholipase/carboxylesterase
MLMAVTWHNKSFDKVRVLLILVFLIINSAMQGQELYKSSTLSYLLREPKVKSENTPMLILLHGVGSNERDLFSFADQLPEKFLVISARAPFTIGNESYAWYQVDFSTGKPVFNKQQEESSRELIIRFIDEMKKRYLIDGDVYLCGFSQGAIMSYSVGLTHPELVSGIALMSGRMLEEIKPLIKNNDRLKKLRIFISHGTQDKTLTVEYARQSLAYLRTLNIVPFYKEYPEGHGINGEMFSDLVSWLTEK